MMYEAYLDGELLYYPNDETFVIYNSQIELALNEAGSFEFDIPECNLRFNDFKLRKSMIQVLQNGKEIFYGEVRKVTQNFDFTKHVYAVGEMAFLFDSIQPQKMYQGTPYAMLQSVLNEHNAQVENRKKFEIGSVVSNDDYVYHFTNREDTLTAIREKLCNTLDLCIRVDKTADKRLISLVPLSNYGTYCKQEIQFGENLIDYSNNMSAQDIATVCIPLGARLEDDKRTANAVDGLDEYLTIVGTAVNDNHKAKNNDYVQIDSAIANYGYVRVVKNWDNVTVADNLQKKAIEWLKSAQYETMELQITALDQNLLDINIDTFDIGDTIHVWAEPFGMDTTFPVRKKTIYLNDLSKNSVTLGNTIQNSFTKQNSEAVQKLTDEIPEVSPILQSAKNNALAMLLAETTGGHVVYEYDATNSYIEAINVCNANEIKNSTKRWVFNLNGLGFMSRDSVKDKWSDLRVAITMNGKIVANFITTGEMSADHIKGGTLEVGGSGYAIDGSIKVKNANDKLLAQLDKSGLQLYSSNGNNWWCPEGKSESSVRSATVLKVGSSEPFRIDGNGRAYATRLFAGSNLGEKGWGTEKSWSGIVEGAICTHAKDERYYYLVDIQTLGLWIQWINLCIDQNTWKPFPKGNPVSELDASVFN